MSSETNTPPGNRKPAYVAYQVRDGKQDASYWTRIGVAWPHKDGKGLDVQLDGLAPLDGRIILRVPENKN